MAFSTKAWQPISVSNVRTSMSSAAAGSIEVMPNSVNWYNRLMANPQKRREVITRYDMMNNTIEISRALDIMSEDIAGINIETKGSTGPGEVFLLKFDEQDDIKKSTIKTLQEAKKNWSQRTGFDINFFDNVREMLQYGAVFFVINPDFSLTKLVHTRIEGYVLESDDDTRVAAYLYNDNASFVNEEGDEVSAATQTPKNIRKIPTDQLLILKVGLGPYGTSVLERVYRTWRHLTLIEDAVIVYRIVRAPERRLFYIDTGRLSGPRAEAYIERVKMKMRQRQVQRNEELDTDYAPQSTYQDFFIATNSDGRSSKVEVLPGGQNLNDINDMLYFNKKLAIGLRIPTTYMQSWYDNNGPAQASDGRVGTAYVEELRYAGYILRLQRLLNKPLFQHFSRYCRYLQVQLPQATTSLEIAPPQSFALYRENDLYNTLFNTVQSANGVEYLSKKFILEKFLHLSKEDIVRNEDLVLKQKGHTDDQIDALSEEQRDMVIYGDKDIPFNPDTNKPIPPITGSDGLFGNNEDNIASSKPTPPAEKKKTALAKKVADEEDDSGEKDGKDDKNGKSNKKEPKKLLNNIRSKL